jgi:hypothetical protein
LNEQEWRCNHCGKLLGIVCEGRGVRLRGGTRMIARDDPGFAELLPKWRDVWGDLADRIGALVLIDVTACKSVTTPPYNDGATEDEMIALYKAKYAEIYP